MKRLEKRLKHQHLSPWQIETIKRDWIRGKTRKVIAAQLEISERTVRKQVVALGLENHRLRNGKKKVYLSVRLPEEIYLALRSQAQFEGLLISRHVENLLRKII